MTTRLGRRILAIAGTAAAAAGIAAGSGVAAPFRTDDTARIRLSWSARPERIEHCRTLSDEELALRPEHMRQRVECEGRFATYALEVAVDGRRLAEAVIAGGGIRNDRPIHDLRDLDVAPGEHRVRVSLARREADASDDHGDNDGDDDGEDERRAGGRDGSGISADRGERERTERTRRQRTALPASVVLDTMLTLEPRRVAVITFDAGRREFIVAPDPASRRGR